MRLKIGMKVPEFDLLAMDGKSVSNKSLLGSRYMISFFRYASCPFCNLRMSFLIDDYEAFEAVDFKIIGLFQSSQEDILHHVGQQSIPFPIVADPKLIIYKKFGIENNKLAYIKGALNFKLLMQARKQGFKIGKAKGPKSTVPGDFLVNEAGIIMHAYYGKDITDHLDLDLVKVFAES